MWLVYLQNLLQPLLITTWLTLRQIQGTGSEVSTYMVRIGFWKRGDKFCRDQILGRLVGTIQKF